jgi:F-type H+-transporting ATPase subunit delta
MQGASRTALAAARDRLTERAESWQADALDGLGDELLDATGLLTRELTLRRALADPALPRPVRGRLVESLLGEQLSEAAAQVLRELSEDRWSSSADLVEAVEQLGVQAAFAAADRRGDLDDAEDELFRFGRIVDREPALRDVVTDRRVPVERKTALVDALLADRSTATTRRLLRHAVQVPRGRTLDRAAAEFAWQAAQRHERLIAEVRSAVAMDAGQTRRLADALTRMLGRSVRVHADVDPDLVGGVVVRVGDQLIDGSIARRMSEVHQGLAG